MRKRVLTVVGQSAYNYKETPSIRLHGRWLEGLGFKVGEKVTIEEEYGRLVVSRIEERSNCTDALNGKERCQPCRED